MSGEFLFWMCVGFAGQLLFTSRFLIQWIVSEFKGESVFPIVFWYLSLSGGTLLLIYAISRRDPVIISGQALGVVVYVRNLVLVHRKMRRESLAAAEGRSTIVATDQSVVPVEVPTSETNPHAEESTVSIPLRKVG